VLYVQIEAKNLVGWAPQTRVSLSSAERKAYRRLIGNFSAADSTTYDTNRTSQLLIDVSFFSPFHFFSLGYFWARPRQAPP
jgi:hypothetical protein